MKIPFDIKYRTQIESGEYKVQTNDGADARIICLDAESSQKKDNIVALVKGSLGAENIQRYYVNGELISDSGRRGNKDLVIVTPKEELTPFEEELATIIGFAISQSVTAPDKEMATFVKDWSGTLLSFAREQFKKDGYVIEKKAFHDAVEKVDPEVMKEVSENVDKIGLTKFERRIKDLLAIKCEIFYNEDIGGCYDLKGLCRVILECARKQLQPEIDAEIKKAYKNADSIVYENGVLYGKAEALRCVPRWRKATVGTRLPGDSVIRAKGEEPRFGCVAIRDCEYITVNDLNRLPSDERPTETSDKA